MGQSCYVWDNLVRCGTVLSGVGQSCKLWDSLVRCGSGTVAVKAMAAARSGQGRVGKVFILNNFQHSQKHLAPVLSCCLSEIFINEADQQTNCPTR